jgi:hypothetical protein
VVASHRLPKSVAQTKSSISVCVFMRARVVAFPRLVYIWKVGKLLMWKSWSFVITSCQVHESWERHKGDQTHIWQVYPNVKVCHINQLWKPNGKYTPVCLHNTQLLTRILNTPVLRTPLIKTLSWTYRAKLCLYSSFLILLYFEILCRTQVKSLEHQHH